MLYEKVIESASHWRTKSLLDRVIPDTCPVCRSHVHGKTPICAKCWRALPFVQAPSCKSCGQEISGRYDKICADCWNTPRSWSRGLTAVKYEGLGKDLILRYKNGGAELYAPALAQIMFSSARSIFQEVDMIAAMPLHWRRMLMRGFNQAGMLATHLSALSRVPYNRHVLKRIRYTQKQGKGRGFDARFQNLEKAIIVPEKHLTAVKNQRVLIIDDVLTSGASLHNCADALREAGALDVSILVFARAGTKG